MHYRSGPFFVLRTPLLAFDTLETWASDLEFVRADPGSLPLAVERDWEVLTRRLRELIARPMVAAALKVAAPDFHDQVEKWRTTLAPNPKIERALTRYVERMSARPTPFGLFAGCSVGQLSSKTRLTLDPECTSRRWTRLDYGLLTKVADHLASLPHIRDRLSYRSNNSLYQIGSQWRYVRSRRTPGGPRRFDLIALDGDEFLDGAIRHASQGTTVDALTSVIVAMDAEGEVTLAEARAYVLELIEREVLVGDLAPLITGGDALDALTNAVLPLDPAAGERLRAVSTAIAACDGAGIAGAAALTSIAEDRVRDLGLDVERSQLLQVDLIKSSREATFGESDAAEILRAVDTLRRVTREADDPLKRFRELFTERYERREVALLEALDAESGIGFEHWGEPSGEDVPLLRGLALEPHERRGANVQWTEREDYLLRRLQSLAASGERVWALTDDDVERLSVPAPRPLPKAFAVLATASGLDRLDEVWIRSVVGPTAASLLGRFCHGDRELGLAVKALTSSEQRLHDGTILAEVVHLPEERIGNIVARPLLRDFEIPFLGRSGAPARRQIPVADLFVSVVDDTVVLRSRTLDARVLPRLSNAHNFTRGQPVYKFLCALQFQEGAFNIGWGWGPLQSAPYLPRVTLGRFIVSRARWNLDADVLSSFLTGTESERLGAVRSWHRANTVPRFAALVEFDNELVIDFENVLSISAAVHLLKGRRGAVIAELQPDSDRLLAASPEGRFTSEVVIPFAQTAASSLPAGRRRGLVTSDAGTPRSFGVGSEWLYLKWYMGTATVDRFLVEDIRPLVSKLAIENEIDRWFFIRYADPHWHVRLRLHGATRGFTARALDAIAELTERMLASGRVYRCQADTYVRETERYGGPTGIVIAEELFWHDSEASLAVLSSAGHTDLDLRWQICLLGWDRLLTDLGFTTEGKFSVMQGLRDRFAGELNASARRAKTLGDRFRAERTNLERLLEGQEDNPIPNAARAAIEARSRAWQGTIDRLHRAHHAGALSVDLETLAGSHLHMQANRLLRSTHRLQEFVMYDFVARLYESVLRRRPG